MLKNLYVSILENPGRFLNVRAKSGSSALPKNAKAAFFTISAVMNFCHTGKELNLVKVVRYNFLKNFIEKLMSTTKL